MTFQVDWQQLTVRVRTDNRVTLRDNERQAVLWAAGQVDQALALQDLHMEVQGRNCEYRWIRTRFAGTCLKCQTPITKSNLCVWVVKGGGILCASCGRAMHLPQG